MGREGFGKGKITHCNCSQTGKEDPGALSPQHDSEFPNAFQVKHCLFKAQPFCCLSSAAKRSKKSTPDELIAMRSEDGFVFVNVFACVCMHLERLMKITLEH